MVQIINLPTQKIMVLIFCVFYSFLALSADETIYLGQPTESKAGTIPACTGLTKKETRGRVNLRDVNKSWPKLRLQIKDYNQIVAFTDFSECMSSIESYKGRYDEKHLTTLQLGNITPGMPSEFAIMLLGPPTESTVTSYTEPSTGQIKKITSFVWTNKKGNFLSSGLTKRALAVAGAATGVTAVVAIANQASTIATTAEAIKSGQETGDIIGSAITIAGNATGMSEVAEIAKEASASDSKVEDDPYSIISLKSANVVTIQTDENNTIQTLSSE